MKIFNFMAILMLVVLVGCVGMSASSRLEIFDDIQRAYRLALRDSDFKAAALVLDPAVQNTIDYHQYDGFKVVGYEASKLSRSADGLEIRREVEIQYYHLNSPVLKTLVDQQLWRYLSKDKSWQLQTGLPKFE